MRRCTDRLMMRPAHNRYIASRRRRLPVGVAEMKQSWPSFMSGSSTDQVGGKWRTVIECALSLPAAGWGGACCALGCENIISVL
jgi:hypothetical protein